MPAKSTWVTATCAHCGGEMRVYAPRAGSVRFCGAACSVAARAAERERGFVSRFWAKVDRGEPDSDGCWLWLGRVNGQGYAQVKRGDSLVSASRIAYELEVGPIPSGHVISSTCRVGECVNPAHMKAVTRKDNYLKRRVLTASLVQTGGLCPKGHEMTPSNTRVEVFGGTALRRCWTCDRERGQA